MNVALKLAWRNLWRHPKRTWLTAGAMVFSNVLLVFMISLQFGTYSLMINNSLQTFTGHMQVQADGYVDDSRMRQVVPDVIPLARKIREEAGSERVAARAQAYVLAASEDRSYGVGIYGVEPEFEPLVSNLPGLLKSGRFLEDPDAAEIVIGSVLARNLRVRVGDELTLLGSALDGSFAAAVVSVVGIFEIGLVDVDRSIAEIPLRLFQDVFYMDGAGHQVVAFADSIDDAPALEARVRELLPDGDLVVQDWDVLQPGIRQSIQADMSSAFFMYGILAILVAFSVLNTQLMSVLERTHEFGIVMALGLKPGRLGRLVLLESLILGLIGLAIGAVLGAAVTWYFMVHGFAVPGMDQMAAKFNLPARMHPQVSFLSTMIGPLVVLVFSMAAALYPALRLHWLKPVEAMRSL